VPVVVGEADGLAVLVLEGEVGGAGAGFEHGGGSYRSLSLTSRSRPRQHVATAGVRRRTGQVASVDMSIGLEFGSLAGKGGWRGDFPLTTGRESYRLDMRGLGVCHPMYLVRLRTFLEWQQREGSPVEVLLPTDPAISTHLAEMGVFQGVDVDLVGAPARVGAATSRILPLTSVADPSGVETLADSAVAALESCPSAVKRLASPLHMAIAELGDNAVSHGRNGLGIRVACSLDDSRPEIRLAVGDLGMGIPEHIRQTHPDWGDDTAAIANAVAPGVSGTRDPHRGNGFLHILDEALTAELGAARLEIYSANGFLRLDIVQASFVPTPLHAQTYKRGAWICYSLISAG